MASLDTVIVRHVDFTVDRSSEETLQRTLKTVAKLAVASWDKENEGNLVVDRIGGGITNLLYKISCPSGTNVRPRLFAYFCDFNGEILSCAFVFTIACRSQY